MSAPLSALPVNACPGATQVLSAARALFAEHGVDGVSMQDIATRAGVSKANIFHHYANKEALHIAVLRDCVGTDTAAQAQAYTTRLVVREVSQGNPERAKHIAQQIFSDTMKERIAFFADAKARGELAEGIDPIIGDMLLGACCMFYFSCGRLCQHLGESIGFTPPATPEAFARAVCRVLTHGMAAPAAKNRKSSKRNVAAARSGKSRSPLSRRTTRS